MSAVISSPNVKFRIINTYGPTECTDVVSSYSEVNEQIESDGAIYIGKPNSNNKIYIISEGRVCGIGNSSSHSKGKRDCKRLN